MDYTKLAENQLKNYTEIKTSTEILPQILRKNKIEI